MKENFKKHILFWLRQVLDVLVAYAFSVLITYMFVGNVLFEDFRRLVPNTLFGFFLSFFLWKGNAFVGWAIKRKLPWEKDPIKTFKVSVVGSVIYTVVIVVCIYWFSIDILFGGDFIHSVTRYIRQILNVIVLSLFITSIFYLVYFFKWWRIAVVNEERLVREAIQLKYDALKNQVNPHFLFNSLSVLSALVETDPSKAKQFIMHFSNIYRYVLEQRDKEVVPLLDEVNFAKSFLELNSIRHGENLVVKIDIVNSHGFVVPLSLQLVLENCLKHNVVSSEKPLTIDIWRDNSFIVVRNTLQLRNASSSHSGIGLETLCKRYEFLSEQRVLVEPTSNYYTVRIPILESIDNVN